MFRPLVVLAVAGAVMFAAGCNDQSQSPELSYGPAEPLPRVASTTEPAADYQVPAPWQDTQWQQPVQAEPPVAVAEQPPEPATRTYTVQRGEGLMAIARRELGDASRWREIKAMNPEIPDNNLLMLGQVIKLPAQ